MSLARFAHFAGFERDAQMARELARIGIVGIDDVAHLARERSHRRVVHHRFLVIDKARVAAQHADRNGVGYAELGGVAVGWVLLRGERFPQAVHDALGGLALDRGHVAGRNTLGDQLARAVDVRVGHCAAGVGLEGDVSAQPFFAGAVEHGTKVAGVAVGERMKETVLAVSEASLRHSRGAITGLRRPARMHAFGPSPFGQVFDDARGHAAGDPQRVEPLRFTELQRGAYTRRGAQRTKHRSGMKAGLVHALRCHQA